MNNTVSTILAKLQTLHTQEIETDYMAIYLFSEEEIEEAQVGYSLDEEGNSLVGQGPGSWQESWLVIGVEEDTDDPIFVDVKVEGYPVFTAMHGEDTWEPVCIFESLDHLLQEFQA
ncbi:hypothetical protein GCM10007140_11360 [Priestia taiwanensis]|uniref:Uncharacterized protein n=2 Tax=Priestia taiwanensis TaxID=1347902 RepID=A0A917AN14_9BACI|nr:hypothetical protein GCM10007140_11360 [Priestia taiwanensis]